MRLVVLRLVTSILATWFAFGDRAGLFHVYAGYGLFLEIHWSRTGDVLASVVRATVSGFHLPGFLLPVLLLSMVRRWNREFLIAPVVSLVLLAFLASPTCMEGSIRESGSPGPRPVC